MSSILKAGQGDRYLTILMTTPSIYLAERVIMLPTTGNTLKWSNDLRFCDYASTMDPFTVLSVSR
jgi:hypothetical protein